ncbi:MAG: hypothetical protein ACYDAB_04910 [bacterium]
MVVASLAIPIAVPVAPVDAQTNSTCLDVKNNRSDTISVAVVGFKEDTSYWLFAPGESAVLVNDNGPLRGSTFTIRLYMGEGVNSGRQLEGSNKYVTWNYDSTITDSGKCTDGAWVATLHT